MRIAFIQTVKEINCTRSPLLRTAHFVEATARRLQQELHAMAQSQSFIGQLSDSRFSPFVELHQSIPSQVEAITPFLDQLMRFIRRFRSEDGSEVDIEIALREALINAIVHGNHENAEKRVYVASRCSQDGEVSVTIRDLGEGFDSRLVPDPTEPENRLSAHAASTSCWH
jgi:serine/threonine-protein kinase RsbW